MVSQNLACNFTRFRFAIQYLQIISADNDSFNGKISLQCFKRGLRITFKGQRNNKYLVKVKRKIKIKKKTQNISTAFDIVKRTEFNKWNTIKQTTKFACSINFISQDVNVAPIS